MNLDSDILLPNSYPEHIGGSGRKQLRKIEERLTEFWIPEELSDCVNEYFASLPSSVPSHEYTIRGIIPSRVEITCTATFSKETLESCRQLVRTHLDDAYVELLNQFLPDSEAISDTSCQYFSGNPYLRCAVNPSGSCNGCGDYKVVNENG